MLNPLAVLLVGLASFVFSGYLSWTQLDQMLQLLWFTHRKTHGQLFQGRAVPWLPRHVDDIRAFHARAYPAAVVGAQPVGGCFYFICWFIDCWRSSEDV